MTIEEFLAEWRNDSDRVLVHTSGSTGKPKPMWVEKQRMKNSARGNAALQQELRTACHNILYSVAGSAAVE